MNVCPRLIRGLKLYGNKTWHVGPLIDIDVQGPSGILIFENPRWPTRWKILTKLFALYAVNIENTLPKAERHWRRREVAIEDIHRVQYSILVKFTKFEINQTNIRRDIAILSIATL